MSDEHDVARRRLELWRRLYATMVRIRAFEERLADLVDAGEVRGPCHLSIGQEAIAAGVCTAIDTDDTIWGGHRSHGHYIAKGGDPRAMMAEIFGKATGCSRGRGGSMHIFAPQVGLLGTVPLVAATIPIAVGAALASKLRGDGRVAVAFFGDGATEEGHFHESVNLAGVYRLPVLFVCENNFYSSHMALLERRVSDNIALTGSAHGIPGVVVDGNDVVEVHRVADAAAERARRGDGPTLLECRTYRWRGHVGTSWDMDVGVRRKDELAEWLPKDPIARLRRELIECGVAESDLDREDETTHDLIAEAVVFSRTSSLPDPAELGDHVFTTATGK